MKRSPKIASIGKECVAYAFCSAVRAPDPLHIASRVVAQLDEEKCVGCGKCAKNCPADVISIIERGAVL